MFQVDFISVFQLYCNSKQMALPGKIRCKIFELQGVGLWIKIRQKDLFFHEPAYG